MASSSVIMPAAPTFNVELTASLLMAQLGLNSAIDIHALGADLEGEMSNEAYALRIQAEYLANMLQVIEDHRLALTFDQGLEANYPAFRNSAVDSTPINPPVPNNRPVDTVPAPLEGDDLDDGTPGPDVLDLTASPQPYVFAHCPRMRLLTSS